MLKRVNPSLIFMFIVVLCITTIFFYPTAVISASRSGLQLWFNTVLPSLFPFMVFANLLIGLGGARVFGYILEPVMRPVFNVSGAGALAYIMGLISGYPVGAKITADLLQSNQITKTEAQRLLSFCNNSGPLFMLGAVGVGMFNSPDLGFFIMIVHYLSSLITGILFRFYNTGQDNQLPEYKKSNKKSAHSDSKSSIGALLSESVQSAMDVSVQVGGFIILFSVIMEIMVSSGLQSIIITASAVLLQHINPLLHNGIAAGIIEITNGIKMLSLAANTNSGFSSEMFFKQQAILTCGLVSWGGISILAQTISIIGKTGLSTKTYIISKLIQTFLSVALGILLYPLLFGLKAF